MAGRPFAVFDIDGTLIRWQLYHAIADTLVRLGFVDEKEYATIREARMDWKRRSASFKAYEHELVRVYNQVLKSLSFEQFNQAAEAVFDEYKDQIYTYTRDLIKDLKAKKYLIFAISGSQAEIIQRMADYYGFDDFAATTFETIDGKFTGKAASYIGRKDEALNELVSRHKAGFSGSIAVGDSTSDVQMLKLVEQPIAFNPEKELFDVARANGWQVVVERKNMIYRLDHARGRYVLA